MGPKSETMDVESNMQKQDARRGRCLDRCLVLSVIFLFAGLTSLAVAGVLVFRDLQSKRWHPEFEMLKFTKGAHEKNENYAYLEAKSSNVMTHTMKLTNVSHRDWSSVGNNYVFNQDQHSLQVKRAGYYFMYLELLVTCHHQCDEGHFTVELDDKLHCKVHLQRNSHSVPVKCWNVSWLSADTKVDSNMKVSNVPDGQSIKDWTLDPKGSGFGLFLVD